MNILIIGGNRFFGRKLAGLLLTEGHEVTLLNRGSLDDGFGDKLKRIICDRTDENKMSEVLEGKSFDVVYDQMCFDHPQAYAATKIFRGKTQRYIFTSTMAVYDLGNDLSEKAFNPFDYHYQSIATYPPDYAKAKRQAESVFFKEAAFDVVAVRFPIVLGTDDYTQRLKIQIDKIQKGEPLFFPNLEAHLSFVHSSDAALGLFKLAFSSFKGPINVASPEPIKLLSLIAMIEAKTKKKALLINTEDDSAFSPYGILSDWSLDTTLAEQNGIHCRPLMSWLPDLIQELL